MKPYGKPSEIRHGCMCCSTRTEHRSNAKADLRKLVQEEADQVIVFDNTVDISEKYDFCHVCGDYKNSECNENC